jgi:transforming growth factor-beta-induced protein
MRIAYPGILLAAVAYIMFLGAPCAAAPKDIVDTAIADGNFKTLVQAVKAAGLVEALKGKGPMTVFAPTDKAFNKLPREQLTELLKPENRENLKTVLLYHVVAGRIMAAQVVKLKHAATLSGQRIDIKVENGKVSVDNARVQATDIACTNGVIHVIDTPILPILMDLAQVAQKAGTFNTLLAAVEAAGLTDALCGAAPLTVFAPTDDAFAKLPAGTVEDLLKSENRDKLVSVLKYHVVAGRVYSDQAIKAGKATTLQGQAVTIKAEGAKVMVDSAKVVKADVEARNGVIHVIDSVILPPA